MKNLFSKIINGISILIILFAAFILFQVITSRSGQVPNVAGYSMLRVLTGSMEPDIPTDSIILVRRTAPDQVQVGDVISFYSSDPALRGAVNTHRVVEITRENELYVYTTKGDANYLADIYPPNEYDLIGVVVFSSHIFGVLIRLVSNPLVFIPLVLLPLLALIIQNMVKAIQSTKELMRQEEEAALQEALEVIRKKKAEQQSSDDTPSEE